MRLYFTLLLVFIWSNLLAQKSYDYYNYNLPEQILSLSLPIQDNEQLKQAELRSRKKGRAEQFAINLEVNVTPHEVGTWDYTNTGVAIWRYKLISRGAKTLNLGFSRYEMPVDGRLYLYGKKKKEILGPFTRADNESHSQLWTPIIGGDEITVEIQIPLEQLKALDIELKYVNHDFINILKSSGENSSGSCNVDVACGAADGFPIIDEKRDIINSVGAFTINGRELCSGALINNTRNDCKPYFLTANHCGVTSNNAATVVVYWNYQNSVCRTPETIESGNPGDGSRDQFSTGSTFIAGYGPSDFSLILLDDEVSPDFNPFFAGWNMERTLPQSAVCIHHPNTEEKRISIDLDPSITGIEMNDTFIRVQSWDHGTTEGGSSGAPLFNDNDEIIGVLNGGQATCINDDFDDFGPVFIAWEGGGTPETRLKDWLDPDDTGVTSMPGKNCTFLLEFEQNVIEVCGVSTDTKTISFSVNENFTSDVNLKVGELPEGIEYELENSTIAPGTNSKITIKNISTLNPDSYQIELIADDGNNAIISNLILKVFSSDGETIEIISPENGIENQLTNIILEWQTVSDEVDIQLSTDELFSSIEQEISINQEQSIFIDKLERDKTYFWRIRAKNICGVGSWSEANSFSTGQILCNDSFRNTELLVIPDTQSDTITSSIDVNLSGKVRQVEVNNISGTHTWVDDLSMYLISPRGTRINLLSDECDDEDNFSIGFSDNQGEENITCPITDSRLYKPNQSLAIFNGETVSGKWRLEIIDNATLDGGQLSSWGLSICTEVSSEAIMLLGDTDISICDELAASTTIGLGLGFSGNVTLSIDPESESIARIRDNRILGGEATTIDFNMSNLESGNYAVVITANDGQTSVTDTINIEVSNSLENIELEEPPNGDIGTLIEPRLSWSNDPNVESYLVQISSNMLFEDRILDTVVNQNNLTVGQNILDELSEYYWRVAAGNDCETKLSPTYTFTTEMRISTFDLSDLLITVAPNPASEFLSVRSSLSTNKEIQLSLYNLNGKKVISDKLNIGSQFLDIKTSLIPSGIYLLKISDGESSHTEKIIIHH